jgi:hypothetical protein
MIKELNDPHALARVWLSTLTANQLSQVLNYIGASGNGTVRSEMATLRSQAAAPPLLSFMDLGTAIDAEKEWHLAANWLPFMIADWLASDMSVHDYYEVFVKGAGVEPAVAQKIAETVVTPDGSAANFAKRVIQSVLDLPLLKDIDILQKMGEAAAQSAATLVESVGARSNGRDNSWEGVLAGEQMYNMMQRARFTVGSSAFEGFIHGPKGAPRLPEGGDPVEEGDIEEGDYGMDERGYPYGLAQAIGDALGVTNTFTETGEPVPPDPARMAAGRAALGMFLDDVQRAKPTGYHAFAMQNPEQGGLFSGLGRKLKRLGKKLGRFVKKTAGGLLKMAPMAFGLPPIPLPIGDPADELPSGEQGDEIGGDPRYAQYRRRRRRRLGPGTPIFHHMYARAGSGGPHTPLAPLANPSTHKFESGDFIREVNDYLDQ